MAEYTHVADKLHGYTLQVRQMMYELISVDLDRVISVESFDDVAVQQDSTVIAEQVKSVTSKNNPLGNRSKIFWKTLFNWLNYINTGALDVGKSIFRIIVSATYDLEAESIAKKFSAATTLSTAESELDSAKAVLIGDLSIDELPNSFRKYTQAIFDVNNRTNMIKLITNMEIIIYKNNFDEVLFNRFCALTIPPEYADKLFIYMLGWVFEETNKSTKKGDSPFISCKAFHDTLVQQTRYYCQSAMIPTVSSAPDKEIVEAEISKQDIYIKQLDLIQADFSIKFDAASDYLQTSAEKTEWAERGTVNPQSFYDYNIILKRMWSTQKHLTDLITTEDEITRGKRLYFTCLGGALTTKIEGKDLPGFFGTGSLHALANGPEKPEIGWHPKYEELLNCKDGNNE